MREKRSSVRIIEAQAGDDPDKHAEVAAVRLLARREHGTQELKRKLVAKGHESAAVEKALEKLGAKRLVSDDRFVSSFVRHHAQRGQGPVRIRAELRQQGIDEELAAQALAQADSDWVGLAAEVRQRKYGRRLPTEPSERAKQARFLQYRGFNADQIRAALLAESEDQAATDPRESLDSDWSD